MIRLVEMASLEEKIQTQRDKIKAGGWKKWGAYLALAAFIIMGVTVALFKGYFLRMRLAKAKTEAAIAKEELLQDTVDDSIRDIALDIQNREANIEDVDKQLAELRDEEITRKIMLGRDKRVITELKDWGDIERRVKWDDETK